MTDVADAAVPDELPVGRGRAAVDAGRLVRYALSPKLAPGSSEDYANLVARYLTTPSFAAEVNDLASGLGLVVLDCDRIGGIAVAPVEASPFAMRVTDVLATYSTGERLLFGLVLLTIAAVAYPTADALDDETRALPTLTAAEIAGRVDLVANRLAERYGPSDPPADAPDLEPLWRLVLRTRADDTTEDGRSNPRTKLGMARRALKLLTEHGLADEVRDATEPDSYRLRSRFRLHVADSAGGALDVLRAVAHDGPETR
jgi:hypothetical protein